MTSQRTPQSVSVLDALTMALVPKGHPARGRWARPERRQVEDVVHRTRRGVTRRCGEGDR